VGVDFKFMMPNLPSLPAKSCLLHNGDSAAPNRANVALQNAIVCCLKHTPLMEGRLDVCLGQQGGETGLMLCVAGKLGVEGR
jgi:hypothetical protein